VKTIVVVQGDSTRRKAYSEALTAEGYNVLTCEGPQPPDYDCPVLKHCGCIDCELADAMVYDPCLTAQAQNLCSERIIYRLREYYPQKPVLVLNRCELPEKLARLIAQDPGVRVVEPSNRPISPTS